MLEKKTIMYVFSKINTSASKRRVLLPTCTLVMVCLLSNFFAVAQVTPTPDFQYDTSIFLARNYAPAAGFQSYHLLRFFAFQTKAIPPVTLKMETRQPATLAPSSHPTRLPWTVECLPFFCKIEHKWALKNVVPVKFRLGSVEYVDGLEGKRR